MTCEDSLRTRCNAFTFGHENFGEKFDGVFDAQRAVAFDRTVGAIESNRPSGVKNIVAQQSAYVGEAVHTFD